jgi:hypothetical protein
VGSGVQARRVVADGVWGRDWPRQPARSDGRDIVNLRQVSLRSECIHANHSEVRYT